MISVMLGLLVAARSDLTVDEPPTRAFGSAVFSEAICIDHKQRYCENKDTRVGVSMPPFYVYDFGDEIRVIYKTSRCGAISYSSYKDISSKSKLQAVLLKARCPWDKSDEMHSIDGLDEIYAATRYMKERAEVVFGPVNKRCWVKRSPSGYPLSTNCPQ